MTIIEELNTNGIIKLTSIYTPLQIQKLSYIYNKSWSKIKSNLPKKWFQITMNENINKKYDSFMSVKLYDNKKQAFYKNTPIIDMGLNRYDFTYKLDTIKQIVHLPEIITNIANKILGYDWEYNYGGLPVETKSTNSIQTQQHGFWHRDVYSLFNNPDLDVSLPPFYITILIPLECINESTGGSTEFILGSHNKPISNQTELDNYITEQTLNKQSYIPDLNLGDIVVFLGNTIHRGLSHRLSNINTEKQLSRKMLYIVCKKTWYNDEPESNYQLI